MTTLVSCNKTPLCDCFDSAGPPSTQIRLLSYFNQVVTNDNVNIFVSIGNPEQVEIEGGRNLISNISANVSGGVLTLHNNNICNWLRSYKRSNINVYITMPEIIFLTTNGIGNIKSNGTINVDTIDLSSSSAGDIDLNINAQLIRTHLFGPCDLTLSGTSNQFESNFFAGTGFMYCNNLISGYTFLSTNTTGDCYINATSLLFIKLYGYGNVYYSGNPGTVNSSIYGTGSISKE